MNFSRFFRRHCCIFRSLSDFFPDTLNISDSVFQRLKARENSIERQALSCIRTYIQTICQNPRASSLIIHRGETSSAFSLFLEQRELWCLGLEDFLIDDAKGGYLSPLGKFILCHEIAHLIFGHTQKRQLRKLILLECNILFSYGITLASLATGSSILGWALSGVYFLFTQFLLYGTYFLSLQKEERLADRYAASKLEDEIEEVKAGWQRQLRPIIKKASYWQTFLQAFPKILYYPLESCPLTHVPLSQRILALS